MSRLNLTYIQNEFKLHRKCDGAELKALSFPHGEYEVRIVREQLEMFFFRIFKKDSMANDIIMKSVDYKYQLKFVRKNLFRHTILGPTKTDYIIGTYTSEKSVNIS